MQFVRFLLFSLLIAFKTYAYSYQFELSMCCIFQDEDRFLKEWIDYHRLAGVEHFYMYDNRSTDKCTEVLEPYIEAGIVEYVYWDKTYDCPEDWWRVQRSAYIDAIKRATNVSKWLCIIDTDEFIVPIKDENLSAFLKDFEPYGGVFINWVFYGSSNIQRIPDNKWITSCLLNRAKLNHSGHRLVKTIVRPERVDLEKSSFPHTCAYIPPFYHVSADGIKPLKGQLKEICIDRIRIHHYWSRDLEFLMIHKYPRNERWYGEQRAKNKIKADDEYNDIYDPLILDVIKKMKTKN